ncbi:9658_t:CDS:1, partial [Gigaspora rosea]
IRQSTRHYFFFWSIPSKDHAETITPITGSGTDRHHRTDSDRDLSPYEHPIFQTSSHFIVSDPFIFHYRITSALNKSNSLSILSCRSPLSFLSHTIASYVIL